MRKSGGPPRTFQIPVKTHKLTLLLTAKPSDQIGVLKEQVLSALSQFQEGDPEFMMENPEPFPKVTSLQDFELCKGVKQGRKLTGEYNPITGQEPLSKIINNWESVFVRFRDEKGELKPVKVDLIALLVDDGDEEETPAPESMEEDAPSLKRKRA